MKIVAHTVARNESRWIWFAINSVLDYVDEILVWDTGSTDKTSEIVRAISSPKLKFHRLTVTADETALSFARQQMLNQTRADWLMILDGDEIWPDASIKEAVKFIYKQGRNYDSIVVPTLNCVGDVFHVSPPGAGLYKIAGKTGHYNLRFINLKNIPGVHVSNPPGQLQSYYDASSTEIQNRDPKKIVFINTPYLHTTHLVRSSSPALDKQVYWRRPKFKFELGRPLPNNFEYPKCFYLPYPNQVSSPWLKRSIIYVMNAAWQTPLKLIKRKIFNQTP